MLGGEEDDLGAVRCCVAGRREPWHSHGVALTTSDFVELLVEAVPEFRPVLDEHLADFDGEVELTVLVADVRRMAIEASDRGDRDLSGRTVDVVDEGFRTGDLTVEDAIAVCFIQDTPWWDRDRKKFIKSWPDAMRDEVERQRKPPLG